MGINNGHLDDDSLTQLFLLADQLRFVWYTPFPLDKNTYFIVYFADSVGLQYVK